MALIRDGDELIVRFCDRLDSVEYIAVSATRHAFIGGYTKVYAELIGGPADFSQGFDYSVGGAIEGFHLRESGTPEFENVDTITVDVEGEGTQPILVLRSIELPQGGVPEGTWLRWDGELSAEPCG